MNPATALIGLVFLVFLAIDPCVTIALLILGSLVYGFAKAKS
jgi:hypothetical protein